MATTHNTVVVVADDGTSPVGTDEWNLAHVDKYQPTEDVTVSAGMSVVNTDPYILDSGRLLTLSSGAVIWTDTITPPSQFAQQKYDPSWDEILTVGATTLFETDPFIVDDGRLITIPSTSLLWMNAPRVAPELRGYPVSVMAYGAVGDGIADDTDACQKAVNAQGLVGGDVLFPVGTYKWTSPITLFDGVRLVGVGASNRWGRNPTTPVHPVRVNYSGATAALIIRATGGGVGLNANIRNIKVHNIDFDGTSATGAVDGVLLDATAASVSVVGLVFEDCIFQNFPRSQVNQPACGSSSAVWGVNFTRCTFQDFDRVTTGNLVEMDGPLGGASGSATAEFTFEDCQWFNTVAASWAANVTAASVRFIGGTVAPQVSTGNGLWVNGYTFISGVHIEGFPTSGIGVRVVGSGGHHVAPSYLANWTTGLQIGDPTTPATVTAGTFATGTISANTTDVHITNGGSRRYTVIGPLGDPAGTGPVILDQRASVDGVYEVMRLDSGYFGMALGSAAAPTIRSQVGGAGGTGIFTDTAGEIAFSVLGTERVRASTTGSTVTGGTTWTAGTASKAPLNLTSGTNLTNAAAGAMEFDGAAVYNTADTTNGRRFDDAWNYFRLTGSGTGITTIADFFGTNDGIPLVANGIYEIEWHCYFSQVTAGTATWTIVTATTALANLTGEYVGSPIGGIGTVGAPQTAAINVTSSSSTAFPVTGTEATAVTHYFTVRVLATAGNGASNTRLRLTMSAGTATPLINSYFRVRRLAGANVGTYVA